MARSNARHKQGSAATRWSPTDKAGGMWRCQGNSSSPCAKAKNTGDILSDCITGKFAARDLHHFQDYAEAEKESERLPKSCI